MTEYRVQLDVFTGPLDLLLYLIKRDEIDVYDIPVARVTAQYLAYVQALEQLDPDAAGEFLVMAATLLELKSRALLPTPPLETLEDTHDPRAPLVRQLLEYKRFKDAARTLGSSADERAKRYVRKPCELPPELRGVELEEVQVWDLLGAFTKVMQSIGRGPGVHEVRYDDTPIELHGAEILAILEQEGPTTFDKLFEGQVERVYIIGRFLAILELIRNHKLRAEQESVFGRIYLFILEEVDEAPENAAPLNAEERPHTWAAGAVPDAASHQSPSGSADQQSPSGSEGQQSPSGSEGQQSPSGSEGQQSPSGSEGQQSPSGSEGPSPPPDRQAGVAAAPQQSPSGSEGPGTPPDFARDNPTNIDQENRP